jgi:hypothetical protein
MIFVNQWDIGMSAPPLGRRRAGMAGINWLAGLSLTALLMHSSAQFCTAPYTDLRRIALSP